LKFRILLIALALILFSPVASAEIYKYHDEQGNIHFTDDYNKVPVDQRKDIKGYKEIISEETDEVIPETAGQGTEETEEEPQEEEAQNPTNKTAKSAKYDFETKIKEFDQRKDELALEYESLMQQNSALAQEKKKAKNAADIKGYNEREVDLNKRLKEHDSKRKQLFSEVEDYNTKVNEENARRQKKQADKKKK
jgi:chromosome segregation ATPase